MTEYCETGAVSAFDAMDVYFAEALDHTEGRHHIEMCVERESFVPVAMYAIIARNADIRKKKRAERSLA